MQVGSPDEDESPRSHWKKGTRIEVYSNSKDKWYPGAVAKVSANSSKITVQYRVGQGKKGIMQKVLRLDSKLLRERQEPVDPVQSLAAALEGLSYETLNEAIERYTKENAAFKDMLDLGDENENEEPTETEETDKSGDDPAG